MWGDQPCGGGGGGVLHDDNRDNEDADVTQGRPDFVALGLRTRASCVALISLKNKKFL